MNIETFKYDNRIVRAFAIVTVIWGIVGMLVGLLAAVELFFPGANLNFQFITFGRIRPLHTNAVIFAFVGNGMFMGIYYSLQRLCKARMFSDFLSWFNFWGWQLIIVSAAVTLPLGYTTSKEYAELEWPIDIAIAVVWVAFTVNLLGTIIKRREKHIYVAIWFFIATAVTIAVLHITNSMEMPWSWMKSYSMYAGVQDALVEWWYGHNAVAFFLTTPYLGLMYYFLPKAAGRPVFSYRLSIVHFWALIFIYIWAGPHHLLYTALPDWAQSLGMVFSLMLIAPSWGGMLNGLLPCGLVYVAMAGAVSRGSLLNGVAYMAMFGLGTLRTMLSISLSGKLFPLAFRLKLRSAIPVGVCLLAGLLILRGLALGIPFVSPALIAGVPASCCVR